jgi:AAA family ATP:ADP antiporter
MFIMPAISLMSYSLLGLVPVLAIVRWAKVFENATDYSIQNTVRNVLFLPTTRDQKYKAKQAIDSFFVRAGDVLSAVLVFTGTTLLGFGTAGFARVNLVLAAGWLLLALAIGREYARKSRGLPGSAFSR